MRRAERLFRLIFTMRRSGLCRAQDLAHTLDVSTRTVYRDIAHLQASGLPIDGEAGVGYVLRAGFDLPNMTFTHDQIDALAAGLAHVERTGDPALADAAAQARAKIQAGLPDPEQGRLAKAPFHNLNLTSASSQHLAQVRDSIHSQTVLLVSYQNAHGLKAKRRLRPLVVWQLPIGWIFSAWCELRDDFRTFRCDRILDLVKTNDHFTSNEQTGIEAFYASDTCPTR